MGLDVVHSVQASLWHMFGMLASTVARVKLSHGVEIMFAGSGVLGDLHEQLALRVSSSTSKQLLLNISVGRAQRVVKHRKP